mgnify:CR=1 FL=1
MVNISEKKTGKTTAAQCPNDGYMMDKVVAWVCPKCGGIKRRK